MFLMLTQGENVVQSLWELLGFLVVILAGIVAGQGLRAWYGRRAAQQGRSVTARDWRTLSTNMGLGLTIVVLSDGYLYRERSGRARLRAQSTRSDRE